MKKFINWMTEDFAPVVNKMARNPWIAAIQESILTAMPFVFIGSFITILEVLKEYLTFLPDFGPLNQFSFGLFSLYLAYLIPFTVMEKKKNNKTKKQAGLAGIAFFLMIAFPGFDDSGNMLISLTALGTGGMLSALVSGIFVAFVMNVFSKISFFGEDSAIPDFVAVWFDTLVPVLIILVVGWVLVFILGINVFDVITQIFMPFTTIGQSFIGFVLLNFIGYAFLYSFGISTWIIYPVTAAITLQGIGANIDAVALGQQATMIHTGETLNLLLIGGGGATLALNIMLAFMSKSKRLKIIGRATLVPSLFNINEPLVFGAPIAFNPILMIPMWIIGLIGPAATYIVMKLGIIPIPATIFNLWYLPSPIVGYLTIGIAGLLWVIAMFALSWVVYYPFFKLYDAQVLKEEKEGN